MGIIHRIAHTMRSGRSIGQDPAARLANVRRRQHAMLADVQRDLDELDDELTYLDAEIARSRKTAARLAAGTAAATADDRSAVARELREKRSQTYAFLTELTTARQVLAAEQTRLLAFRKRLEARVAECDALTHTVATGTPGHVRSAVGRIAAETTLLAEEGAGWEAEL